MSEVFTGVENIGGAHENLMGGLTQHMEEHGEAHNSVCKI